MQTEQIRAILAKPIAQQLLTSNIPARLAYTGLDGFPRVIPIAYIVEGDQIKLFSPVNATKVPSLRENPNVAITIDTTGQTPPHILLIRGVASIEIVDGVPQGFLDASLKTAGREAMVGFEDTVRGLYKKMAIITVKPTWAKLIDFQETLPQPILELVQQQSAS